MNLEVKSLCKKMGNNPLFSDISFSSEAKVLAFIGSSGSGKSTLMRLIAGLDLLDSGSISLDGMQVPDKEGKQLQDYRKSLGIVFQSFNLFPHINALENIMLPLKIAHNQSDDIAYERATELLKRFDLLAHANKKPSQLSGGQNQRVAILRAVAHKPSILLLDEPTSALDPIMTSEVLDLLAELKIEGSSFILVSHHLPFLKKISDEILFLSEGKIIEHRSSADFFQNPQNDLAKNYLNTVLKYK